MQLSPVIYLEGKRLFQNERKSLEMYFFCRYALQARSFVFFITDEGFVTTVLTELIRALQAEVKTQVFFYFLLFLYGKLTFFLIQFRFKKCLSNFTIF